jgi:cytochrome c oxidase accessory protein FixG
MSYIPDLEEDTEEFRDTIATVDKYGKRIWLYPKKPSGRFYNARTWVSFAFLAIFLTLPFIKIDGEQIFLFNVLERKFVLFGLVFTPQDFHLFVLAMLTFLVFIILFTVVFGRLFCGWVCPQTVFMEMVFRKIEYWIEGDAGEQRRLDKAPWDTEKIQKKTIKHLVFFLIAFVVSNYFLAYVIGMDQVIKIMEDPLEAHVGGLLAMLLFSGVFYGVFSRMREQVCTTICPYGRLQGVLLVKDSIVVAYDHKRGEPRGKLKKNTGIPATVSTASLQSDPIASIQNAVLGDCIDCRLCVAVCPTGIDIRHGTQLECTNCTACIDACDQVMDKIDRPRGLIRYDSETGIESGVRKIFTPRVYAYSLVLVALLSLDVFLIANRGIVESIILRSPGMLYQEHDVTHITNLYTYKVINKTNKDLPIKFQIHAGAGEIIYVGAPPVDVPKNHVAEGVFFINMESDKLNGRKTPLTVDVISDNKVIDQVNTNFMGPGKERKEEHKDEHKEEHKDEHEEKKKEE